MIRFQICLKRSFTPSIKLEHVISFSDAVFAFAITFMALSVDIPDLPII